MFLFINCSAISITVDVVSQPNFHLFGLKSLQTQGTFFMNTTNDQLLRRINDEKHLIGITITDPYAYSTPLLALETYKNASLHIQQVTGQTPILIRVPETLKTKEILETMEENGFLNVPITKDFFQTNCSKVPSFDAKKYLVKQWEVFRFSSSCPTTIYSKIAYYKIDVKTPLQCMRVKSSASRNSFY